MIRSVFMSRTVLLALVFALLLVGTAQAENDLRRLAAEGLIDDVRAQLAAGAAVDAGDRYGATALFVAAQQGDLEMVELLLENGAQANVKEGFYHRTALAMAIDGKHEEVALRLIDAGAIVDDPQTLSGLIRSGQAKILRALAEKRPFYPFEIAGLRQIAEEVEAEDITKLLPELPTTDTLRPVTPTAPERFAGTYTGIGGANGEEEEPWSLEVAVQENGLVVTGERVGEKALPLTATTERWFISGPEADARGIYFGGRSTSVEWIMWFENGETSFARPADPDFTDTVSTEDAAKSPMENAEAGPATRGKPINWGGFRGPGGTGVADGQGAPTTWDVEKGENVLWKAPIPGLGNSSPVVWGDRVYVSTAVSAVGDRSIVAGAHGGVATTGDLSEHTWQLLALDKKTGDLVWERAAGTAVPQTDRHTKSSQANSTPVTNGEYVVAVFPTVGMFCYNADGELQWKKELGRLNASWFSDETVEWGFAGSPVLYDDLVILQVDVSEGPYIAAWNLKDGEEVWRVDRAGEIPTWTTPAIYRGERDELIANGTTIRSYDPKTGRQLWQLAPNSEVIIAMPVIGKDLIYVGASYPPVRPLYAVRPGGNGDISLNGEESNKSVAWHVERGGSYMPTPLLYGDLLYVGHHQGRLITYEAATGEQVYRTRFSKKGTLTGSPVASDDRLYFAMEEGLVYVVQTGPEYQELAVNDMKEIVMTTPAISDGALFIRTRTDLYALGSK